MRVVGILSCVTLAQAVFGCSGTPRHDPIFDPTFQPDPGLPGPSEWNRSVTKPSAESAASARTACTYTAGTMPAETQGVERPNGTQIPVDTIVVAMMENRSFDHYFQKIREAGLDADVAPDDFSNPDTEGTPVHPFRDRTYCFVDTAHGADSIARQLNGDAMDGFVITSHGNHEVPANGDLDAIHGKRAMGYYTREDLPFAYWLAENFSLGDRYFSSAPTATWPNRMYMFAATSFGEMNNDFPKNADKTIFDYLNERNIEWKFYYSTVPTIGIILEKLNGYLQQKRLVPIAEFHTDAAAGTLPQVAFVDPDGVSTPDYLHNDEHPPALMELGQKWLGEIVDSLVRSDRWDRSAMFITYDEHGGLYDHVPPPHACPPDERFEDPAVRFDRYGVRVPFHVISPFAKKGFVSHRTYDHTSILRFIEARFMLPSLTARDANAEAPWDMFDFKKHASKRPQVPVPAVDPAKLAACQAVWTAL
jgi:phospholipase C